ncbi:MAG: glycosyltransferase family 9 protein [Patescibacteria group bacterium]
MNFKSLENFSLLVCCLVYALVRGAAKRPAPSPKRVCIIQTAKMGDMICTTPMFRAVKERYPEAEVIVVGDVVNEQTLRGNPDIARYLVWHGGSFAMAKKMRALACDFGCTAGPDFSGLAALYLGGVPCIAAPQIVGRQSPLETKGYRMLRRLVVVVPHVFNTYAAREYLRLLEPIGVASEDTRKHLYYTTEAAASVQKHLQDAGVEQEPFAVIAPGAGHKSKEWPPERFAQVAGYIAGHYMAVAVIGAAGDRQEVAEVFAHTSNPRVVNMSEKLSIEELKAFISRAKLFVSADAGPLYIAEAFGVPTIDIVGPATDTAQPPHGPRNIVLVPPRERPQMFMFDVRHFDPVETKRQAEATTVKEVTGAVDKLFL